MATATKAAVKDIEKQLEELQQKCIQFGKIGSGEMDKKGEKVKRYKIEVDFGEGSGVA